MSTTDTPVEYRYLRSGHWVLWDGSDPITPSAP